jgi:sigma-B regulation protein RsbU (phosphoserine phosphatase)
MKLIEFIRKQSKPVIVLEGFLLVVLLGVIDYATGEELFFLEFYLLPIILLTWFVSEKAGIIGTLASGIFWFLDDVFHRPGHDRLLIPYWNVLLKILVFVIFTRILAALKEALDREKAAEQEKVQRELEIARDVQLGLFPQVLPRIQTMDYFGVCEAADVVGGDYYDFLLLSNQTLGVAIGDVSGKGISSALLMANIQAMLRSNAMLYPNATNQLVREINNLLYQSNKAGKFATFFYGVYESTSRRFCYVNAGHNPPLLLRKGAITHLNASGTVIGLFPDREYKQVCLQLEKGDLIVLFTDGLVEARNSKEEEFGEERVSGWMAQTAGLGAKDFITGLLSNVKEFVGQAPQHDDLTVVALKIA